MNIEISNFQIGESAPSPGGAPPTYRVLQSGTVARPGTVLQQQRADMTDAAACVALPPISSVLSQLEACHGDVALPHAGLVPHNHNYCQAPQMMCPIMYVYTHPYSVGTCGPIVL